MIKDKVFVARALKFLSQSPPLLVSLRSDNLCEPAPNKPLISDRRHVPHAKKLLGRLQSKARGS